MMKIRENTTMIPQIWFEKMEALEATSEGTWPWRGDPRDSLVEEEPSLRAPTSPL